MYLTAEELEIKVLGPCRIESPLVHVLGQQALQAAGKAERILVDNRLSGVVEFGEDVRRLPAFELAGPRDKIYFDPSKTRVGIVTCGGICPGLNNVIRGLVYELHNGYGVRHVYGFRYGYEGFVPQYRHQVIDLTPDVVSDIHQMGGTILGSSRGPQDPTDVVDCLDRMNINVLFTIGGDGTQRGAIKIVEEIERRGLRTVVVGIPKTIDNDIPFIQRSFGFETAYTEAGRVIRAAKAESRSSHNGVALVRLMGRHSGFIACHAALAQTDADFVLIPEVSFALQGENGFFEHLRRRLVRKGGAVVVVAEGAGQEHIAAASQTRDASGNVKLKDIGVFLSEAIRAHFAALGMPFELKYIDPSYAIRSVPANSSDSVYSWHLARNAVHCAMCGNTEVVIGYWKGHFVYIPMRLATSGRQQVDPRSSLWFSVIEATGQPPNMV